MTTRRQQQSPKTNRLVEVYNCRFEYANANIKSEIQIQYLSSPSKSKVLYEHVDVCVIFLYDKSDDDPSAQQDQ